MSIAWKEMYEDAIEARRDDHARIRELEAQVESLQNKWASRPLSSEDQARRIEELEAHAEDVEKSSLQAKARIRELEQELTNANTDWHESETARVHAERLLRELIDIEGPQPGHVEWYRRVRALLGMTETETKGDVGGN